VYLLATVFDPRYGHLDFVGSGVRDAIRELCEKDIINLDWKVESSNKLTDEEMPVEEKVGKKEVREAIVKGQLKLLKITFENDIFKKKMQKNMQEGNEDADPLKFWEVEKDLNLLKEYARFQLGTMSSSAPIERGFKGASRFSTWERPNLDPENVEMCTFVRQNYRFIKYFTMDELVAQLKELRKTDKKIASLMMEWDAELDDEFNAPCVDAVELTSDSSDQEIDVDNNQDEDSCEEDME